MREYAEAVAKAIKEKYNELNPEVVEVVKMNDEAYVGVQLKREGSNIAPIYYINPFCEYGASVDECVKEIMDTTVDLSEVEFKEEDSLNWEAVKDSVTMRLINLEYNEKYLADKVHIDLKNGLAVMFDINRGDCRVAVTNDVAKTLECDEVMLVVASQNSKVGTPTLYDLAERMFVDEPTNFLENGRASHSSMLVLTAKDTDCGASMIYKSGVAEKIEESVGEYYLLPSSVHEWIVVPTFSGIAVEELRKMVEEANNTVVDRGDLLSYGVYKWEGGSLKKIA